MGDGWNAKHDPASHTSGVRKNRCGKRESESHRKIGKASSLVAHNPRLERLNRVQILCVGDKRDGLTARVASGQRPKIANYLLRKSDLSSRRAASSRVWSCWNSVWSLRISFKSSRISWRSLKISSLLAPLRMSRRSSARSFLSS